MAGNLPTIRMIIRCCAVTPSSLCMRLDAPSSAWLTSHSTARKSSGGPSVAVPSVTGAFFVMPFLPRCSDPASARVYHLDEGVKALAKELCQQIDRLGVLGAPRREAKRCVVPVRALEQTGCVQRFELLARRIHGGAQLAVELGGGAGARRLPVEQKQHLELHHGADVRAQEPLRFFGQGARVHGARSPVVGEPSMQEA